MMKKYKLLIRVAVLTLLAILTYCLLVNCLPKHGITCKAHGNIYINGYRLSHVTHYRLMGNGGVISINGDIFQGDKLIGSLGRQVNIKYQVTHHLYTLTTSESLPEVTHTLSAELEQKILPEFIYTHGKSQNIKIVKLGGGYLIDYNSYPIVYCY